MAEHGSLGQGVDVLQWDSGALDNGGERIQIVRPADKEFGKDRYWIRLDRVNYEVDYPWPTEPDGDGKSLSQKTPNTEGANYGNDVFNWQITEPNPGE